MKNPPYSITPQMGFTLVELLVTSGLLVFLSALVIPAVRYARQAAHASSCANNLHQLYLANSLYAIDSGHYVAAAPDIRNGNNNQRWHGTRANSSSAFDPGASPLAEHLGPSRKVKTCPAARRSLKSGFELGAGGYGYNVRGVGSQAYLLGSVKGSLRGMRPDRIQQPSRTVMFTDTAFPQKRNKEKTLIEYSFAEAYYHLSDAPPVQTTYVADPSIHFRHQNRANVVWCDGHVSKERMSHSKRAGGFRSARIGWFGGTNNELFDPF